MQAQSVERKYALTKVEAGDYILPSNDAQTIWRIATYEDGPTHGVTDMPRDRTFWGVWRWRGDRQMVDVQNWDEWSMEAGALATRAEAIAEALRLR